MYYQEELERMIMELKERRGRMMAELKKLPEGTVIRRVENGNVYYLRYLAKKGNRKKPHRYSLKGNEELIVDLLRRKYIQEALPKIKKDIEVLERAAKSYQAFDPQSLQQVSRKHFPELEEKYFDPSFYAYQWMDEYEQRLDFFPEDFTSQNDKGTQFRSKGEMYIASRLEYYGIPYRYENDLEELNRVPDFTIIRPRDGKVIYWEHMGMMWDEEYWRRNERKLEEYAQCGIVPWRNLILTFDNEEYGIDGRLVDKLIEAWLL